MVIKFSGIIRLPAFIVLSLVFFSPSRAETAPGTDSIKVEPLLKIFINGDRPDDAYLRKEIPYVNFVRDQNLSDLQVLIASIHTASGGVNYELKFIGRNDFKNLNYTLKHNSSQEETYFQRRKGLVDAIKMGLLPFVSQSGDLNNFSLTYKGSQNSEKNRIKNENDPWHHWVFQAGADGSYYKEASVTQYGYSGSLDANYITEKWRIRNSFYTRKHVNHFIDSGDSITAKDSYTQLRSSVVKTISGRLSMGVFGRIQHSTYRNYDVSYNLSPAVEYNFFPWEDVARREFTVAYHIGYQHNRYIETTIYDKRKDILGYHSLNINFRMIQPWGNINSSLEGSDFFENPEFYSVQLDTRVSARITKNLSFRISLNAQSIHDQIYLPQGDASLEDILLQQRSLATTYQYSFSAGLQFTFGSIYNNVINRRL